MKKIVKGTITVIITYLVFTLIYYSTAKIIVSTGSDQDAFLNALSYIFCGSFYAYLGVKYFKEIRKSSFKFYHYLLAGTGGFIIGAAINHYPILVMPLNAIGNWVFHVDFPFPHNIYSISEWMIFTILTGIIIYECLSAFNKEKNKQ